MRAEIVRLNAEVARLEDQVSELQLDLRTAEYERVDHDAMRECR